MTVDIVSSEPAASFEQSIHPAVPTGWVEVSALDVPSGDAELRDLLEGCLKQGLDDAYDIADDLGLDLGLVQHGLLALSDTSGCRGSADAAEPSTPGPFPRSLVPGGRLRKARIMAQRLDPARTGSARVVLKAAAARAPVTLERAKAITRLSGDDFEDILDELVISGELVTSVDGTRRIWVRGG